MTQREDTLIAVAQMNPDIPALDLHGESRDNALIAVDYFLDQSAHAGEEVVKVIYGVGSGALAHVVVPFVKRHPCVVLAREAMLAGESGSVLYAVLDQDIAY